MSGHNKSSQEADDFMIIPGLGENKPKSRVLGSSFFGYIPDAFSMKTPNLPSERISSHGASSSAVSPSIEDQVC